MLIYTGVMRALGNARMKTSITLLPTGWHFAFIAREDALLIEYYIRDFITRDLPRDTP